MGGLLAATTHATSNSSNAHSLYFEVWHDASAIHLDPLLGLAERRMMRFAAAVQEVYTGNACLCAMLI